MQAYLCLYAVNDSRTFVLIFLKRERGYFFSTNHGTLVPAGQPLNGAGLLAFPGGRKEKRESAEVAALREFKEETTVDVRDARLELLSPPGASYRGFGVQWPSVEGLRALAHEINSKLEEADVMARRVAERWVTDYSAIRGSGGPLDNELQEARVERVDHDLIGTLNANRPQTGWFAEMLVGLQALVE